MKRLPATILLVLLRLYQRLVSPAMPRRCKYEPTCSAYAADAIRELGLLKGGILAVWRLLRCNPFSHGGYDPVSDSRLFRASPAVAPVDDPGTDLQHTRAAP